MTESLMHSPRGLRPMLIVSLVGLSWWFFGNLYEAIVISPNWIVDSPAQLTRLHEFFVNTDPTLYFVPATLLAVLLLWISLIIGRQTLPRRTVIWSAVVSTALIGLTAFIVSVLVTALFGPSYLEHEDALSTYAWWWNIANLVRMALTATTIVLVWKLLSATPARRLSIAD
jgi:hypothetical protein